MIYTDIPCDSEEYQTDSPYQDLPVKHSNVLTVLHKFNIAF